jgi:hypothetical protein
MWFRFLSLLIGTVLLAKATVALMVPGRFYAARQRQYDSESSPPQLLVAPAVVIAVTLLAWYATIYRSQPWGWLVTAFLTALACMSVDHVFRWGSHRRAMLKAVTNPKVSRFDWFLLAVGFGFVALALLVY